MKSANDSTWFGLFKKTARLANGKARLAGAARFAWYHDSLVAIDHVLDQLIERVKALNEKLVARHAQRTSSVAGTASLIEAQAATAPVVEQSIDGTEARSAAQSDALCAQIISVMERMERMQDWMAQQVKATAARGQALKNYTASALQARDAEVKDEILAMMAALLDSDL